MDDRFPYGYDLNAYIDKAFEQMKADFPWATREMITRINSLDIAKVDGEYQYVFTYNDKIDGEWKPVHRPLQIDCDEFIRKLASDHEWDLEMANPVKSFIDVKAENTCRGDWFLEQYRIRKHEKGGYSTTITAGNRSAGGSRTFFIPVSYFKMPWDEFLNKYLELVSPGPFYVGRDDLERDPRIKEFLGF